MEQVVALKDDGTLEKINTTNEEETVKTQAQTDGINKLLMYSFVVMLISGMIALCGYLLYK